MLKQKIKIANSVSQKQCLLIGRPFTRANDGLRLHQSHHSSQTYQVYSLFSLSLSCSRKFSQNTENRDPHKYRPNRDHKSKKSLYTDPVPKIRTHLGTVTMKFKLVPSVISIFLRKRIRSGQDIMPFQNTTKQHWMGEIGMAVTRCGWPHITQYTLLL